VGGKEEQEQIEVCHAFFLGKENIRIGREQGGGVAGVGFCYLLT
jgi:hypothetical protein